MRLTAEKKGAYVYALEFAFDWGIVNTIRAIKANPAVQSSFVFVDGKWRFNDLALLPYLKEAFPDMQVSTEVEVASAGFQTFKTEDERRRQRAIDIKGRLETDFVVNGIKGDLYGYQKVAVEFLVNSGGRGLIADEMGAGKTLSALGYVAHTGVRKTLVICPAVVRGVWRKEVAKWTRLKSNVIEPSTKLTIDLWNSADVHIISYHSLKKHFDVLKALKIDCLICDESHRCLPYGAEVQTLTGPMTIGGIVDCNEDVYVASCTPSNHVVEYRKVLGRSRRLSADPMVLIKHEYGEFICTKNHRVWSGAGYKEASSLSGGDTLCVLREREIDEKERKIHGQVLQPPLCVDIGMEFPADETCPEHETAKAVTEEEVPRLLKHVQLPVKGPRDKQETDLLRRGVLGQVEDVVSGKAGTVQTHSREVACDKEGPRRVSHFREAKKSSLGKDDPAEQRPRVSSKGSCRNEEVVGGESHIPASRWKREAYEGADSSVCPNGVSGGVDGARYTDYRSSGQIQVPTTSVQGRLGPPRREVSYRGRRQQSPYEEVEVFGQEEREGTVCSRVESVTVLEQGSERGAGEGGGGDPFVYSIEVEGNHNYFADGVLVANCKEPKTQWTKLTLILAKNVPNFLALTGTPVLSRPKELFTTLYAIAPQEFSDYWKFMRRYCDPKRNHFGWTFNGATNQEELRDRISSYFIRRTKEEILPYLPAKVYVDVPLPLDDETANEYRLAEDDFIRYLENNKDTKTKVATVLTQMGELRRLSSVGKIGGVIDFVENLIESGKKVILFSAFNEPIKQLKEYFGDKAVMIIGETKSKERDIAVDKFQEDAGVRVFLGGLISSGEGITLTAADTTIFIDRDWVPAHRSQAEARMHRPGTKHTSVTIYDIYTEGTIDERMKTVSESKMAVFEKLFGDSTGVEKEMVGGVLDSYKKPV